MEGVTEENARKSIDAYQAMGLKPDFWWMDAGWYPCGGSWPNTGTWEVDKTRFPNGIRAVTDYLHQKGIRSILWFEPERVTPNTWLTNNHPEWILGERQSLVDFGNPEAWKWIVNRVDGLLVSEGIDIYRQDFNMDPLPHWRANDAADRQGITEIRHVTGLLAYLGRAAAPSSGDAVRQLRFRRPPQRSGKHAPRRAVHQERLRARTGRRAVRDLWDLHVAPLLRGHLDVE